MGVQTKHQSLIEPRKISNFDDLNNEKPPPLPVKKKHSKFILIFIYFLLYYIILLVKIHHTYINRNNIETQNL